MTVLHLAGSGTGSIKARFENIAKQKEEEDKKRAEEERARRHAKEKQEQEEARDKVKVTPSPTFLLFAKDFDDGIFEVFHTCVLVLLCVRRNVSVRLWRTLPACMK